MDAFIVLLFLLLTFHEKSCLPPTLKESHLAITTHPLPHENCHVLKNLLITNRALIFIAHGFGEHCSRYETLGNALAEEGFLAFSHDHSKYLILPVKAIRKTDLLIL